MNCFCEVAFCSTAIKWMHSLCIFVVFFFSINSAVIFMWDPYWIARSDSPVNISLLRGGMWLFWSFGSLLSAPHGAAVIFCENTMWYHPCCFGCSFGFCTNKMFAKSSYFLSFPSELPTVPSRRGFNIQYYITLYQTVRYRWWNRRELKLGLCPGELTARALAEI